MDLHGLVSVNEFNDRGEDWVLVSEAVIYTLQSVALVEDDAKDSMLVLPINQVHLSKTLAEGLH